MGSSCCTSNFSLLKKVINNYYSKKVREKLLAYKFDSHVPGSFVGRVAKENDVSPDVAKKWIEYYTMFMIYVGWLFNTEQTHKRIKKPSPEIDKYMCLPFEILQVWRSHVLFTDKYSEFCQIVSAAGIEFIPFTPTKPLWKKLNLQTLQQNFKINREILLIFATSQKKEVDALFVFQSSYLKNLIHFNLEEGSENLNFLIQRYEQELINPTGIFSIQARSIDSLKTMADRIQALIDSTIPAEISPGRSDWLLSENIQGPARHKIESFQNISFPPNFAENFSKDHILSLVRAETYIDEYKKFLYLAYVTRQTQCPSEEVDNVWHYHQTHVREYLDFSALKMERKIFSHNPANGTQEDAKLYPMVYENTKTLLQNYFGYVNINAWPDSKKRFNQTFKWFSHHTLMQRCASWKTLAHFEDKKYKVYSTVVPGCYIGCGFIYGGPIIIGCGVLAGCGGYYYGCGIGCGAVISACGGGSWCSGSCGSSGCTGAGSSCGSGCSAGSSCGSGCGSGCGGGGCGG
jgi:hypothetical protein